MVFEPGITNRTSFALVSTRLFSGRAPNESSTGQFAELEQASIVGDDRHFAQWSLMMDKALKSGFSQNSETAISRGGYNKCIA